MNPIQFSALIDSAKANKDKTLTLQVETQELSSEDVAKIFELFQRQIWVAFAETPLTREQLNIPEVVDEIDKKSPSQRLRNRMYVYHQSTGKKADFDGWYRTQIEKLGEKYLEKVS